MAAIAHSMAKEVVLLLLVVVCLLSSRPVTSRVLLSVDTFGAVGDGITDNTQAFQNAWLTACSADDDATLEVPAGKVYLIGPISFFGPCREDIKFLVFGTIVAPSDPDTWKGRDTNRWIYFHGVNGLQMSGGGTINGKGQEWWAQSCKRDKTNPCRPAPKAVTFQECRDIKVQGLTLLNSQQFHITFEGCSDVTASFLKVTAPADSPNTDGIHLKDSKSVHIEDNLIATGDDCVSITGNSSDIRIRDISCGPGHGISIGSLGKYHSTDHVKKVKVDGCFISNTQDGLQIKSSQGGSGYARKIKFRNVMMKNVSNPIIIDQYYCDSSTPCANKTKAVKVEKISYIDIKGTSATQNAIKFACSDTSPCRDLFLKDIYLTTENGYLASAYCWNAFGKSDEMVIPASCLARSENSIKQYASPGKLNNATATYI